MYWRASPCAAARDGPMQDVTNEVLNRQTATPLGSDVRITVRDLEFFYGANRALKGITIDLADRRVTGMIGPSGCGKSTLLRVLNRMYDLYPGTGKISSRPIRT